MHGDPEASVQFPYIVRPAVRCVTWQVLMLFFRKTPTVDRSCSLHYSLQLTGITCRRRTDGLAFYSAGLYSEALGGVKTQETILVAHFCKRAALSIGHVQQSQVLIYSAALSRQAQATELNCDPQQARCLPSLQTLMQLCRTLSVYLTSLCCLSSNGWGRGRLAC